MRLLFRTYVHSRRASAVSVAGLIVSALLALGVVASMMLCLRTEEALWMMSAIVCGLLCVFCFRFSRKMAEDLALRDLESRPGHPAAGVH